MIFRRLPQKNSKNQRRSAGKKIRINIEVKFENLTLKNSKREIDAIRATR